ncbi:MAG: hypothetical protein CVU42_04260 [Chloroflexi bacterium HGW-Chloroflexi-4]|nr:MAG: hypothetical protein CVU42_04260 [Chloroflexi bacterium HGW-Chloroflexi-4]
MFVKPSLCLLVMCVLLLSVGCKKSPGVPVGDIPYSGDEILLEEEVFDSEDEKELGSISLNVINTFSDGVSSMNCDTTHTVYMLFYSWNPKLVTNIETLSEEVVCETVLFRSGGGGTADTTATIPITYNFHTKFLPYPQCHFLVQVDVLMQFSQVKVLHDSVLGDIPLPEGLGDDLLTVLPEKVFKTQGETQTISEGLLTLTITPDDYVVPFFTRCKYVE